MNEAENTAVNAAKAIIKIYDFTASVLEALARSIADLPGYKIEKYNILRLHTQNQTVIKRYLKNPQSFGEIWVKRYLSTLFSPKDAKDDKFPFLVASLINSETRPPSLIYGILERLDGEYKSFYDYYFLWLNERLKEICENANQKEYGYYVENIELRGKSEQEKLKAHISFQITPLLDINDENLPKRAKDIKKWFEERINKADNG